MGMFLISYDVKNSNTTDNRVVLINLVRVLKCKLNATSIVRPVASTLRFECKGMRNVVWNVLSTWASENGVWYLASEIVESEDGKHWRYIENQDESLQGELNEILKALAKESAVA